MKIFIRAASCISPQQTFNHQIFLNDEVKEYCNNVLNVIEPDYATIIDARQMRRMSRIIRLGLASALGCLKEAGLENVDSIITGTAYGCMEDSEKFLKTIVDQDEAMLSPTAFIQSTHNTVGAQIALSLKCHAYNNTFVHRGFSFEHAVIDSMLLLNENKAQNILAGSADEITGFTFAVLKRFGMYKQAPVSNFELYSTDTRGSICGEGAAFFLLSNQSSKNDYALLEGMETFYKPAGITAIQQRINKFLSHNNISIADIDLIIIGKNGDCKTDKVYDDLQDGIFNNIPAINYKYLCGEYPTSSSFATWLAANILKQNKLPAFMHGNKLKEGFKRILMYNNYQTKYHSLILLSAVNN